MCFRPNNAVLPVMCPSCGTANLSSNDVCKSCVPITINFRNLGEPNINRRAPGYLHRNPDVNIIGINRGERNLIYVVVINQKGEVLEQRSLNVINGVARGYQLANKFEGLASLGRQSGLVFYVPPWKTSNLDPTTGFANLFPESLLSYVSVEVSKDFFGAFSRIAYSPANDYFEFGFSYSSFRQVKQRDFTDTWTFCSYGDRIARRKSKEAARAVDVIERLRARGRSLQASAACQGRERAVASVGAGERGLVRRLWGCQGRLG